MSPKKSVVLGSSILVSILLSLPALTTLVAVLYFFVRSLILLVFHVSSLVVLSFVTFRSMARLSLFCVSTHLTATLLETFSSTNCATLSTRLSRQLSVAILIPFSTVP